MSIRFGVEFTVPEQLELLPELNAFRLIEIPGEFLDGALSRTLAGRRMEALSIRNIAAPRVLRELPGAGAGVQMDFLRLMERRCAAAVRLRAECAVFAPDVERVLANPDYETGLRELLGACFGIASRFRLPLGLELRIPGAMGARAAEFLKFRKSLLYSLRTELDFHPHEPGGFELLDAEAPALRFDRDFWRVGFEAASGNYLSAAAVKKCLAYAIPGGIAPVSMIFSPGPGADADAFRGLNELVLELNADVEHIL